MPRAVGPDAGLSRRPATSRWAAPRLCSVRAQGVRSPPAPASHGSSGAVPPKPACTPQSAPAPINPSSAGRPRRKKAEKETITIRSIRARVATSPARAAAATVMPLAEDATTCAAPPDAGGAGSKDGVPVTAACTSCHECQCAPAVTVPATPADAAAMSTPVAIAAALRRITATGIHMRRGRTPPEPCLHQPFAVECRAAQDRQREARRDRQEQRSDGQW